MIDATKLGQVTAALMESLDTGDEEAEVGEVMVLAEIRGEDDEGDWSYIAWRCSDERSWVQRGLLRGALEGDREATEPGHEADS